MTAGGGGARDSRASTLRTRRDAPRVVTSTAPVTSSAGDRSVQAVRWLAGGRVLLERGDGWPLVWDQDQDTAIQSPFGLTKIAWCGPPLRPREGCDHLHFHLAPRDGGVQAEVDRLASLGTTRQADDATGDGRVVLADPDGNEFCVLFAGAYRSRPC
jgi:hypothetical protein